MPDWRRYKLGDLIKVNEETVDKNAGWINYIDISSVNAGFFDAPRKIKLSEAPSRAKRLLKDGDTVISSVRPYLKAYFYFKATNPYTVASTGFAILSPKKIDPRFLYYVTTNDNYIQFLTNNCTGSAYPAFNPEVIEKSIVYIPDNIAEQLRIAEILSSLDDKIELNLEMNKTLEEMAMAIYKEWFVDFGPFRDGEFVDSELGSIPKGWEVKDLNHISNTLDKIRKPISSRERLKISGYYPYYGATGILDWINDYKYDGRYVLMAEDGTVMTKDQKPYLQFIEGKFWVSNHAHVLKGKDYYSDTFLYHSLSNLYIVPYVTGAVQLKISRRNMDLMKFVTSSLEIHTRFDAIVNPLIEQIFTNKSETETLKELRDYLLPKLISGEVRVKAAEEKVKEVL